MKPAGARGLPARQRPTDPQRQRRDLIPTWGTTQATVPNVREGWKPVPGAAFRFGAYNPSRLKRFFTSLK